MLTLLFFRGDCNPVRQVPYGVSRGESLCCYKQSVASFTPGCCRRRRVSPRLSSPGGSRCRYPTDTVNRTTLVHEQQVLFYQTEGMRYFTQIECRNRRGTKKRGCKVSGFAFKRTSVGSIDAAGTDVGADAAVAAAGGNSRSAGSSPAAGRPSEPGVSPVFGGSVGRGAGGGGGGGAGSHVPEQLLVTTNDSRLRLYNTDDFGMNAKYKGFANDTLQITATFSEDGKQIISGSENGKVCVPSQKRQRVVMCRWGALKIFVYSVSAAELSCQEQQAFPRGEVCVVCLSHALRSRLPHGRNAPALQCSSSAAVHAAVGAAGERVFAVVKSNTTAYAFCVRSPTRVSPRIRLLHACILQCRNEPMVHLSAQPFSYPPPPPLSLPHDPANQVYVWSTGVFATASPSTLPLAGGMPAAMSPQQSATAAPPAVAPTQKDTNQRHESFYATSEAPKIVTTACFVPESTSRACVTAVRGGLSRTVAEKGGYCGCMILATDYNGSVRVYCKSAVLLS